MSDQPQVPALRVVAGGTPTDEELAAVVVALTLRAAAAAEPAPAPRSAWADRRAALRRPLVPGPDAWRRSLRRD